MSLNTTKIVYIADLSQDIDDLIAIEYLNSFGLLSHVVYDAEDNSFENISRIEALRKLNIPLVSTIPPSAKVIFCGGKLKPVEQLFTWFPNTSIDTLVMNGGFVGSNCVPSKKVLPKFKDKNFVKTYNFNLSPKSTNFVLQTVPKQIGRIILVGKNVCHDKRNTVKGIWNTDFFKGLQKKYNFSDTKLLHDVLACHEGLALLNYIPEEPFCFFHDVYPTVQDYEINNKTEWGSKFDKDFYFRKCYSAIYFKD